MNKIFDNKQEFTELYRDAVMSISGKSIEAASDLDRFNALAKLVAEKARTVATKSDARATAEGKKRVYYFSIEFLIGRLLDNYLLNFGVRDMVAEALDDIGFDLSVIENQEPDPALGNGGLGRLAACFLDSMAAEGIAGYGNGMRYRYGLFKQEIVNGSQVEATDEWLTHGYPWEVRRQDKAVTIKFGGHVEGFEENGRTFYRTVDTQDILAVPYDIPVVGYAGETVNKLRVWAAEPVEEHFDLEAFNRGDYALADAERAEAEAISAILYPNDAGEHGRLLRLKQEYLFVSAGIYSLLDTFEKEHGENWELLPQFVAIHTNDTHPAMCGPELMRILIDEKKLEWDDAWNIVTQVVSYTNHTILPEALEKWPIGTFSKLLPRVYQIIDEISRRWHESFDTTQEGWQERLRQTAILWDGEIRMANLSVICSHSVNGVAKIHSDIIKNIVLKDFYALTPEKFNNKTNGISHRRFFAEANPTYAKLVTEAIGDGWLKDAFELEKLKEFQNDSEFLKAVGASKRANKERLAAYVKAETGLVIDPNTVFDVQVKRFHAYKRQLMNIMKVMDIYNRRIADPNFHVTPTTFIFSGKAASSYTFAKETIRLINSVADVINNDAARQRGHEGLLHPQLPREQRPAHLPRRRDLGADLHGRQGGLGHVQHEAHDERRHYAGHPRRRQHRDRRPGRSRERGHLWPDRPRGRAALGIQQLLCLGYPQRRPRAPGPRDGRAQGQHVCRPFGQLREHLQRAHEQQRPRPGHGRLPQLRGCMGEAYRQLRRPGDLEPQGPAQHRLLGLVLERPHHSRVPRRDLARVKARELPSLPHGIIRWARRLRRAHR